MPVYKVAANSASNTWYVIRITGGNVYTVTAGCTDYTEAAAIAAAL